MPVALDLNTLSQPLREVFQSIVGERDEARVQREELRQQREKFQQEAESERHRLEIENKLLKERIRLLLLAKYGPKAEATFQRATRPAGDRAGRDP